MNPKGKLLIIGGAEKTLKSGCFDIENPKTSFKYNDILKELLPISNERPIEIITTGSTLHCEVQRCYEKVFKKMHYPNFGFIPIQNKIDANNKTYLKRIEHAGSIFFTGGNQFRIASILKGTPTIDLIQRRYHRDKEFLLAGTSAGAMAMSRIMISDGESEEVLKGRNAGLSMGLDIIHNCIIDSHFIKRSRFGRLIHAVLVNPELLGIGLGEDTALIITAGKHAHCLGSGTVVIIDGKDIKNTNIIDANKNDPIFSENIKIHILVAGCHFSIDSGKLMMGKCHV